MRFEWDAAKNSSNQRKHGLAFEDAELVFAGRTITFADTRKDYAEPRFVTLGRLLDVVVVIIHTPRGDAQRIISMRKANAKERARYQK